MIRVATALFCVLALAPAASAAAACAGPNPAITSVVVKNVTASGQLKTYHLAGTVTNLGSQAQPSNSLQFVDIYGDTDKHDTRGIPPLAPGQSYTFRYDWQRSADAGNGTTTLHFRIDVRQGSNCNPNNGTYSVTF
jgi:subtilase family serine protease